MLSMIRKTTNMFQNNNPYIQYNKLYEVNEKIKIKREEELIRKTVVETLKQLKIYDEEI